MKPEKIKKGTKMAQPAPVKASTTGSSGTKSGRPKTLENAPAPGEEAAP